MHLYMIVMFQTKKSENKNGEVGGSASGIKKNTHFWGYLSIWYGLCYSLFYSLSNDWTFET